MITGMQPVAAKQREKEDLREEEEALLPPRNTAPRKGDTEAAHRKGKEN